MSTDLFRRYGNLLRSDGTNQLQRLLPGLEPDYIVPDERSLSDLIEYAYRVAAEVRFYDLSGQSTGDWTALLDSLIDPTTGRAPSTVEIETLLAKRADWPPHLVLFLVCLKLFRFLQDDSNRLPEKHLRYYYERVLALPRRAAVGDDVHVIFELAQNAVATLLPVGTLLDAGKDANGRALSYTLRNEVVVSAATLKSMRRLVMEHDARHNLRVFIADGFTEAEAPGGYLFGRRQLDLEPSRRFMSEAPLGFAIAAPILALAEGKRTVKMLAHLRAPVGATAVISQGISYALKVEFTGAEGWLTPDSVEAILLADGGLGQPALSLTATLGTAAAAIVDFDAALHGPSPAQARPAMRCRINGESGLYEVLDGFTIERVALSVEVKGVRTLVVQNDDGPLTAGQPLPLFGSLPRIGSTFYIGSNEVFGKRLTSIDVQLEWKSPPEDMFDHYRAYFDTAPPELTEFLFDYFRANLEVLYDRSFRFLTKQALFEPVTSHPSTLSADPSAFAAAFAGAEYVAQPDLPEQETFTASSRYGFMRLVLTDPTRNGMRLYATKVPFEAFGHPVFARRYAQQVVELANGATATPLPNDPYTPTLSALSLDYTATAELIPEAQDGAGGLFVVGPFGAQRATESASARLVPPLDGSAALFLGIENLQPPANLSMFFQIDVGTATAAEVLQAGETEWSYLGASPGASQGAQEAWRSLNASALLIDSTQGFQKPGVIAIALPRDATLDHQSMPAGLVWLRALIRRAPDSAARAISIRPHGALASLQPAGSLADYELHLRSGLPAGIIKRLTARNSNIRSVEQPNPSFQGRGEENALEYFRRSNERLRHRHRAVTSWDMERLVLEAFPDVFKVKCLQHTNANGAFMAGHTALVIVPNLRRVGGSNVLEPRAGAVLLGQIEEHLASLRSPFAIVHVIPPVFERIRVAAKVVFTRGRDPGYYTRVLNDELRRFLSPWAYQEGEDIQFGTRIYRSEILAFIEGRDYVDHIVGLRLFHSFDGVKHEGIGAMTIGVDFYIRPVPQPGIGAMQIGEDFVIGRPIEVAQTTQAHAILVSHPDHLITPVAPGTEVCAGVTRLGIGYMTVGLDFDIEESTA